MQLLQHSQRMCSVSVAYEYRFCAIKWHATTCTPFNIICFVILFFIDFFVCSSSSLLNSMMILWKLVGWPFFLVGCHNSLHDGGFLLLYHNYIEYLMLTLLLLLLLLFLLFAVYCSCWHLTTLAAIVCCCCCCLTIGDDRVT